MRKVAHITIAGEPFCGWLNCQAGQDKAATAAKALDVDPSDVTCGHRTLTHARTVAAALRPLFRRGAVAVVPGDCPAGPQ